MQTLVPRMLRYLQLLDFVGHAIYTLNDDGLVQTQEQMWSKSAVTALQESFTPTSGPKMDIKELKDADVL